MKLTYPFYDVECIELDCRIKAGEQYLLKKMRIKENIDYLPYQKYLRSKHILPSELYLCLRPRCRPERSKMVLSDGDKKYLIASVTSNRKLCKECGYIIIDAQDHACVVSGYVPVKIEYNDKADIDNYELTYDIECSTEKNGKFKVYCIVLFNSKTGEYKDFSNTEDFVEYLYCLFNSIKKNSDNSALVTLITYNGSRYDDIIIHKIFYRDFVKRGGYEKGFFEAEKGGALIFSSVKVKEGGKMYELKFLDLTRYLPNAKSLRSAAKDFNLDVSKSFYPYDLIGKKKCDLDSEGFIAEKYFISQEEYLESKKVYREALDLENGVYEKVDLYFACVLYCKIDVLVTYKCYQLVMEQYKAINGHNAYNYHGAPSFCVAEAKRATGLDHYYAPIGESYQLVNDSLSGGWVGFYYSGITYEPLSMVDIVSHYPCSLTGRMPVGGLRKMTAQEQIQIHGEFGSYDLETLPLFIADVRLTPPSFINCEISSVPQRDTSVKGVTGKGQLVWSYKYANQTLNSVDLYTAYEAGWRFTFVGRAEIADETGPIFRDFITTLGEKKKFYKKEGNATLTMMYKIMLNSCIGAMGRRVEKRRTLRDPTEKELSELYIGAPAGSLVEDKIMYTCNDYVVINSVDTLSNTSPCQWASFMYGYSRYIRARMAKCLNPRPDVDVRDRPILFYYGDTDSVVTTAEAVEYAKRVHPEIFGKDILGYNSETREFDFNIEVEDLYQKGEHIIGIFISKKCYALISSTEGKVRLKGHKIIDIICEKHNKKNCYCLCVNDPKLFSPQVPIEETNGEIIYSGGVTLAMMYCIAMGYYDSFLIRYGRFVKSLASAKDSFSVAFRPTNVIFRMPKTNYTYSEIVKTTKFGKRLLPLIDVSKRKRSRR